MRSVRQTRARQSEEHHGLRGLVRRVVVGASGALWQFLGYLDGDDNRETFPDVEVFQGIGFSSRPRAGSGEAVLLSVGDEDGHPVVVATRDRSLEVTLDEDETAIFNSQIVIRIKKDGTIEIGGRGATLAAIDGLVTGRAVDVFTGMTQFALQNTSTKVKAEK